jgi:colanic acid/amylovoran biosynthesis glycosyltransferase
MFMKSYSSDYKSDQLDDRVVVAHFCRSYLPRTETFISNQLSALKEYRPVVFCHHRINDASHPMDNVTAIYDMLPKYMQLIDGLAYKGMHYLLPYAANAVARLVLAKRTRLLHFHFLVDARFFLAVKRLTGLPALVSAYGYDVGSFPRKWLGLGQRYLAPLFHEIDLFTAMSNDMKQDLMRLGCPQEKIVVHYHGIDTGRFAQRLRQYCDKPKVKILVCATLTHKKGQHLVLEALRLAHNQGIFNRDFHLTFVGDGPMLPKLLQQVRSYGWQDRVTFAGYIPHSSEELVRHYQNADIFSLPSRTAPNGDKEGIPGTIVEAMASGLPIIASRHAGIPEVVCDGRDGILVQEGNVAELALAFSNLVNNVELRQQFGQAAAFRALTELDLGQKTRNLESIYTSILRCTKSHKDILNPTAY